MTVDRVSVHSDLSRRAYSKERLLQREKLKQHSETRSEDDLQRLIALHGQDFRRFLVEGSLSVDMWSGELLLKLKLEPQYSDIELVVVLPYPGHDERWDARSRTRLAFLIQHSAECITVGTKPWRESFIQRDRYLVDHADRLLAVYNGEKHISEPIISYASKKNISVIYIYPNAKSTTEIR